MGHRSAGLRPGAPQGFNCAGSETGAPVTVKRSAAAPLPMPAFQRVLPLLLLFAVISAHSAEIAATPPSRDLADLPLEMLMEMEVPTVYGASKFAQPVTAAPADVTVLGLQSGRFGFVDSWGGRIRSDKKLVCAMTLRDGKVVYDLDGLARPDWETLPRGYRTPGDPRWDAYSRR